MRAARIPRYNHYDLGIQVFQDEQKIAMLYNFDNRWRMIWTDGRPLPKVVDGGVEMDGEFREARWFRYSGRPVDRRLHARSRDGRHHARGPRLAR